MGEEGRGPTRNAHETDVEGAIIPVFYFCGQYIHIRFMMCDLT